MRGYSTWLPRLLLLFAVLTVLTAVLPLDAWADTTVQSPCTQFSKLAAAMRSNQPGMLTEITNYIKDTLSGASQSLFNTFVQSPIYANAVYAAMVLMVTFYGVAFLIGVAQPSYGQILIRLVKMGVIFTLVSPDGWQTFNDIVVRFFNDGTDEIIGNMMQIGTGIPYPPGASPFLQLDGLARFVISPDMIVAMLGAMFSSGPYGFAFSGLIGVAIFGMVKMLIDAVKTYGLAFIVRSLLLGVAPIFLIFLMFDKTRGLFSGWLNALVNLSLQPIVYFTFIAFFVVMLQSAATNMLAINSQTLQGMELCWADTATSINGTSNKQAGWHFRMAGETSPPTESWTAMGNISCLLQGKDDDGKPCEPFPVNIIDVLTFLILVHVATKFGGVADRIAAEISNSAVNLDKNMQMLINSDKDQGKATPTGGGNRQSSNAPPPTPTGGSGGQRSGPPTSAPPAPPAPPPAPPTGGAGGQTPAGQRTDAPKG